MTFLRETRRPPADLPQKGHGSVVRANLLKCAAPGAGANLLKFRAALMSTNPGWKTPRPCSGSGTPVGISRFSYENDAAPH